MAKAAQHVKVRLIVAGAIITIASTLVSDLSLSLIDDRRSALQAQADKIRTRELEHQYNIERSFHDLDNAWTLASTIEVEKPTFATANIRNRIADTLLLSLQEACLAGDSVRCKKPLVAVYAVRCADAATLIRAFALIVGDIRSFEAYYGQYITKSNATREQLELSADYQSRKSNRVRLWGAMFQILGIIVVLLKDLVTDSS